MLGRPNGTCRRRSCHPLPHVLSYRSKCTCPTSPSSPLRCRRFVPLSGFSNIRPGWWKLSAVTIYSLGGLQCWPPGCSGNRFYGPGVDTKRGDGKNLAPLHTPFPVAPTAAGNSSRSYRPPPSVRDTEGQTTKPLRRKDRATDEVKIIACKPNSWPKRPSSFAPARNGGYRAPDGQKCP
jgi:hypothetical protein